MDLDLSPTPTPTKSDDETEVETPPHTSSDSIKNHHSPPVAYKECMKNHAANIGGHAVDGCGEFMPGPSADPISLKCAACGCHRSFHRRDPESPTTAITPPFLDFRRPGLSPPRPTLMYSPHMLISLSTPAAAVERHHDSMTPTANNPLGRKRFRTRFSQEQKEKMHSFSEKLGWKMQKSDEAAVEEFCREVGVAKGVLKVWIHNNKTTIGKKETPGVEDGLIRLEQSINGDGENGQTKKNGGGNCGRAQNESGGGVHFHDSNNGSCSSP